MEMPEKKEEKMEKLVDGGMKGEMDKLEMEMPEMEMPAEDPKDENDQELDEME